MFDIILFYKFNGISNLYRCLAVSLCNKTQRNLLAENHNSFLLNFQEEKFRKVRDINVADNISRFVEVEKKSLFCFRQAVTSDSGCRQFFSFDLDI